MILSSDTSSNWRKVGVKQVRPKQRLIFKSLSFALTLSGSNLKSPMTTHHHSRPVLMRVLVAYLRRVLNQQHSLRSLVTLLAHLLAFQRWHLALFQFHLVGSHHPVPLIQHLALVSLLVVLTLADLRWEERSVMILPFMANPQLKAKAQPESHQKRQKKLDALNQRALSGQTSATFKSATELKGLVEKSLLQLKLREAEAAKAEAQASRARVSHMSEKPGSKGALRPPSKKTWM